MWMFTPIGFFSATLTNPKYKELPKEQQTGHIMVRARVRDDLVRLIEEHQRMGYSSLPGKAPEILALPGHDYPYRIVITHMEWTALVSHLASRIDYSNFKNAVEERATTRSEGTARHDLYLKVWSVMNRAEEWLRDRAKKIRTQRPLSFSQWTTPQSFESDPRSHRDLSAQYNGRGWDEWLAEDEADAVASELPEGTHDTFDPSDPFDVSDEPTADDIARLEAALLRPDSRRNKKR